MLRSNLSAREMEVMIDHIQRGVTEYLPEGKDVTAVEQIVNSEGMSA